MATNTFPTTGNAGIGTTTPAYPLQIVSNDPNDTSTKDLVINSGADGTLGPLDIIVGGHPSMTGTNRYGFIGVGDNISMRNLALNSNGSGAFGNVGIGTTSPTNSLQVAGGIAATTSDFAVPTLTGSIGLFQTGASTGNTYASIQTASSGGSAVNNLSLQPLGGSVGVGTTTPKSLLDINGGISAGSYAGVDAAPTGGMIVSGNVGVGTPTPNYVSSGIAVSIQGGGTSSSDYGLLEVVNPKHPQASGDYSGEVHGINPTANGTEKRQGLIAFRAIGTGGANGMGGQLELYTKKDNASTLNLTTYDNGGNWSFPGNITVSGSINGTAGGDLSGTFPNPTLALVGPGATGPIGSSTTVPVITIDAKGRVTALTSAPVPLGFVYPEAYGAAGNGTTDDYAAITSAIAACSTSGSPNGKILIFTQNYAISSPININCSCWSTPTSSIIPHGTNTNGIQLTGGANKLECTFGYIFGFSGYAIQVATVVWKLRATYIQGSTTGTAGTGVAVVTDGGGDIDVGFMTNLVSCFSFSNGSSSNGMQGNEVHCSFATTCNYGVNFDGSANADSNCVTFSSWDAANEAGSIFYNSNASTLGNPFSNWKLEVINWIGGWNTSGTGIIANGAFQFCRFYCGCPIPPQISGAYFWGLFNVSTGGGNTFWTNSQGGFSSAFGCTWQSTANNRTNYTGGVGTVAAGNVYKNQTLCNGTTGVAVAAGGTLATYVYTPFIDGNSEVYRAVPTVNPGFMLLKVAFGSNPNEIVLTWMNVSGASIASGTTFAFQFIHGIP